MAEATPTPAEVASLPDTGGAISPGLGTEIILLSAGALVLISALGFALARRAG